MQKMVINTETYCINTEISIQETRGWDVQFKWDVCVTNPPYNAL